MIGKNRNSAIFTARSRDQDWLRSTIYSRCEHARFMVGLQARLIVGQHACLIVGQHARLIVGQHAPLMVGHAWHYFIFLIKKGQRFLTTNLPNYKSKRSCNFRNYINHINIHILYIGILDITIKYYIKILYILYIVGIKYVRYIL